jgi:hypothetical protein
MARPSKQMVWFIDARTARFGGCVTGIDPVAAAWSQPIQKTGRRLSVNFVKGSWPETTTLFTSSARANSSRLARLFQAADSR